MVNHTGQFDANLAAVAGDDPILFMELREAFMESFRYQVDLLTRARCDGNWEVAAQRLRGLGASFHFPELADLAERALDGPPGEPVVVRQLQQLCAGFAANIADG